MSQREVLERVLKTVGLRLVEGTADQAVEVCCRDTGWKELRKWFCILDGRVGAENEPVGFCSDSGGGMESVWLNLLFGGESHFASLDRVIDALKKADSIVFCPIWAKLQGLDEAKAVAEVQKNIFCGCASLEEMLVKADLVDYGQGWQERGEGGSRYYQNSARMATIAPRLLMYGVHCVNDIRRDITIGPVDAVNYVGRRLDGLV